MTGFEIFTSASPLFIECIETGTLQTIMQSGILKVCKKNYFIFTKYTYWESGTKDTPIEKKTNV